MAFLIDGRHLNKAALIFGLGYVGTRFSRRLLTDGWSVSVVVRNELKWSLAKTLGLSPIMLDDQQKLRITAQTVEVLLVTAPPFHDGCPALIQLGPALLERNEAKWVAYLSSTSVYGDQQCQQTDESAPLNAVSQEGLRRTAVENAWKRFADAQRLPLNIFRLAAIYGPGRSALDKVKGGTARRIVKQGHLLSRVYIDDIVDLLYLSIAHSDIGETYNVSDGAPGSPQDVIAFACQLLNVQPPPEEAFSDALLTPAQARFFTDCRRISSQQVQDKLGWLPRYPSYREGLRAIMKLRRLLSSSRSTVRCQKSLHCNLNALCFLFAA